ncbi:hypothetical protein PR048_014964 [Dryococelus australis]|uniref:Uncharacterized protein n=1 Tax=Dryococelus australis TaxID=614101 RepID=A0ABQ9HFM7_9NEOP|nr:hypothetical protein PR048_014964 [Dryococelus australis]
MAHCCILRKIRSRHFHPTKDASQPRRLKYIRRMLLDARLTWHKHMTAKQAAGHARLDQLHPILNSKGSLSFHNGKLLYEAGIRHIMTHAAPAWGYTTNTTLRKLQVMQNKVLRSIARVPRYTPTKPIHKELKMQTITRNLLAIWRNNSIKQLKNTPTHS